MLVSLFNTAADLKACNFVKKRLQHNSKFSQIFKNIFFTEYLRWLPLKRVCEAKSLVKILHSSNFSIFGINDK